VISQRRGIGEDLAKIRAGAVILELSSRIPVLPDDYGRSYGLLCAALDQLGFAADPAALLAGFWVRHMELSGNPIVLGVCFECGGDVGESVYYRGGEGCVCAGCNCDRPHELNRGLVGFIGHTLCSGPEMLGRLRLTGPLRDEMFSFLINCTRALTDVSPVTIKAVLGG
jgi:recombinational DNA repair protein (RecF pathway)